MVKKRWISLIVENEIGTLAKIAGLFSSKSYNIDSLTVGVANDITTSRMTISLTSDDKTFEQVKKQLNRSVEVIKVLDFTDKDIYKREIMLIKSNELDKIRKYALDNDIKIVKETDYILLELCDDAANNDQKLEEIKAIDDKIEIVRTGNAAISL